MVDIGAEFTQHNCAYFSHRDEAHGIKRRAPLFNTAACMPWLECSYAIAGQAGEV